MAISIKTDLTATTSSLEWGLLKPILYLELTGSDLTYLTSSFQWWKNSGSVSTITASGAGSSSLTWANNISESAGIYYCIWSSGSQAGTSSFCNVSVVDLIKTQPQNVPTSSEWSPFTMSLVITSSLTASYSWKVDGIVQSNTTASTPTSSYLTAPTTNTSSIIVYITSGSLAKTSSTAVINKMLPLIATQPASITSGLIQWQLFSMNIATQPVATCSFQWKIDGVNQNNTSSTPTSSILVSAPIEYTSSIICYITSGSYNKTSSTATLSNIQNIIKTQPVATNGLTEWQSITFTLVKTGSAVPTYQWLKNGTAITDATSSVLTLVLVDKAPNQYVCLLSSASVSGITSSTATITTINPLLLVNPTSSRTEYMLPPGVGFSIGGEVISSSSPAYVYQWSRNGDTISGETNQNINVADGLSLPQIAGTYNVIVYTKSGSVATNGVNMVIFNPGAVIEDRVWNPYAGGYWQSMY